MMNQRGQVVHVVEDIDDSVDESMAAVEERSNHQVESEDGRSGINMPMPVVSQDGRLFYLIR